MKREYERVAEYVANEIEEYVRGDRNNPASWVAAAQRMNCVVASHKLPSQPPGQYFAPRLGGQGVIAFNRDLPPRIACAVLVHEIAHHILMREITESLFGHVRTYGYTSAEDTRDLIARRVESLIFPGLRRSAIVRRFQTTRKAG